LKKAEFLKQHLKPTDVPVATAEKLMYDYALQAVSVPFFLSFFFFIWLGLTIRFVKTHKIGTHGSFSRVDEELLEE
jgi:hypothetical protein